MSDFYKTFYSYILGDSDDLNSLIVSDDKGDAIERMAIYRNAYLFRLVDILVDDFPTLHQILGDEEFYKLVQSYLKVYPSQSYTVRDLGGNMITFLKDTPPYQDYPYLTEIAEFEWQKGRTFDGADAPIFTQSDLAKLDLSNLPLATFTFQPTVKRLVFSYDVPQIYKAIQDDNLDSEPKKMPMPVAWVMWRKALDPHWLSMEVDIDWALQQAINKQTFADICGGLSEWIDEEHIPARAASILRLWIDEEMLQSINL